MATPIFPILTPAPAPFPFRGIEWDIQVTPAYSTEIVPSVSRRECSISYDPFALITYKYSISVLRDTMDAIRNGSRVYPATELAAMWDFLAARRGSFEPFGLPIPWDKRVEGQVIYPSSLAGVTDYQVVRQWKPSGKNEPVGIIAPITGVDKVYRDGSSVSFTPNLPYDGWIRLAADPGAGHEIKVDLSYYAKVRFLKDDGITFRTFGKDVWEARTVEFRTKRP